MVHCIALLSLDKDFDPGQPLRGGEKYTVFNLKMKNLVLAAVVLHVATAGFDGSVCTQPGTTGAKTRPTISPTFEVHVECTIINKQMTTEVHEFYDQTSNHGEVRQTLMGVNYWAYYDYSTNEFLGIYPQQKICQVSDLSKSDQRFLFGYNTTGTPTKNNGRIFSAAGALHFSGNNVVEQYQGSAVVRGIRAEKWYSCQYWQGMDATMNVTWYFSDPNNWNMALGIGATPIRAWVKGKVGGSNPHPFEHVYDLIFFRNFIETPHAFETPSLVTCPGRRLTKSFPYIGNGFSFSVEIIDTTQEEVRFMQEWYDHQMSLVRYIYTPMESSSNGVFGYRPLTEIHDFNTGMAYITDNQRGNCTWQLIEKNTFDDIKADAFDVRIRSATQFFYMNISGVTYEGVKSTRNINTDVYVANRQDYPPASPLNSTFEWRFLTNDYQRTQKSQAEYSGGVPVQMHLNIPSYDIDYIYNIYNYVQATPVLMNWDISACYVDLNRKKFDFTVPGSYATKIDQNRKKFLYATQLSLMSYMTVSPLRVSELKLVFMQDVHIRFQLLDIAPMNGDVRNHATETPLNTAAKLLTDAINQNKLVIPFAYDSQNDVVNVVATAYSIQEYTYEDQITNTVSFSGYTAGSMGGLAIGMLVLGSAIGGGVSYFFFK